MFVIRWTAQGGLQHDEAAIERVAETQQALARGEGLSYVSRKVGELWQLIGYPQLASSINKVFGIHPTVVVEISFAVRTIVRIRPMRPAG